MGVKGLKVTIYANCGRHGDERESDVFKVWKGGNGMPRDCR